MEGGVGGLNYVLEGGTASTLHYNHRGDVIMKSDAQGYITHGWSYDAFGKATQRKGSEGTLRHAASTKEADTALLLNEGFRERDVETGLFLSTDPLEFVDGPNMYAYVRQNPVSSFDPWGLATHAWHHYFPQAENLKPLFEREGIDIHDSKYGLFLETSVHTSIHSGKDTGRGGAWNKEWTKFFESENKRLKDRSEIFAQLGRMRRHDLFRSKLDTGIPVVRGVAYDDYKKDGKQVLEDSQVERAKRVADNAKNEVAARKAVQEAADGAGDAAKHLDGAGAKSGAKKAGKIAKGIMPGLGILMGWFTMQDKGMARGVWDIGMDSMPGASWVKMGYELGSGEDIVPSEEDELAGQLEDLDREIDAAEIDVGMEQMRRNWDQMMQNDRGRQQQTPPRSPALQPALPAEPPEISLGVPTVTNTPPSSPPTQGQQ